MDANAKVGADYIEGDPNVMSSNGELLIDFVERNNLIICNGTDLCKGLITRTRSTVKGKEESVIDYVIVCQELFALLLEMKIDETNALTRYRKQKDKIIVTKSDQNLIFCCFKQSWNSEVKLKEVRQKNIQILMMKRAERSLNY